MPIAPGRPNKRNAGGYRPTPWWQKKGPVRLIASILLLVVLCLMLAAIWTVGDNSGRFAGTAFVFAIPCVILFLWAA